MGHGDPPNGLQNSLEIDLISLRLTTHYSGGSFIFTRNKGLLPCNLLN